MPATSTVSTQTNSHWSDAGLGRKAWIANATAVGVIIFAFLSLLTLFSSLVFYAAHAVTTQAVDAHKATAELYMKMADQAAEREKAQRQDMERVWLAINENAKINKDAAEINKQVQLMLATLNAKIDRLDKEQSK